MLSVRAQALLVVVFLIFSFFLFAKKTHFLEIQPVSQVQMLFVGDMMFDRGVRSVVDKNGGDYSYLFEKIGFSDSLLMRSDLVVGNLEGVIGARAHPIKTYDFSFEESVAKTLKMFNFDAVSLANNHTLDQGVGGYINTKEVLSKYGLGFFGHQVQEEGPMWSTKIHDRAIGFVGFNLTKGEFNERIAQDVIKKIQESSDFVIVQVHWGEEYKLEASLRQINLGHKFVEWGAGMVLGHHPHVMQGMEIYKDSPIFYSLGNFIFDQEFSKETKQSLMVEAVLVQDKLEIVLHPLFLEGFRPQLKTGAARDAALLDFVDRSQISEILRQDIVRTGSFAI